jgi:hypothetical protein
MDRELLAALLGPVSTALLAAFGIWLREWRQRRDRDQRRRRALTEAREEVAFIEAWVKTHELVAPADTHERVHMRAHQDLERAYTVLAGSLAAAPIDDEPFTLRRLLRSLLLLRPLETNRAKAARVVYYLSLAWAAIWAAVGTDQTVKEDFTPTGIFVAILVILVFGVAPAWGLGAWVLWLDKRTVSRSMADRQTLGEPAGSRRSGVKPVRHE